MKKILVLLAALFVCAAAYVPCRAQYISGYADLSDSDVTKTLKNHISYLASDALEGRKAGSEGEYAAAEYVRDMFKEYGIDLLSGSEGDVFGISMPAGDTLTSRNVVGFVLAELAGFKVLETFHREVTYEIRVFFRIDRCDAVHRNADVLHRLAEARLKGHLVTVNSQIVGGLGGDAENDGAVGIHELLRADRIVVDVHEHVRGVTLVFVPLQQGLNQIALKFRVLKRADQKIFEVHGAISSLRAAG